MSADRVLVAFASQTGSTARIAATIAEVLAGAGLRVDCRPVAEVDDILPYAAVVLGSGVFLARRHADGGGFLERHAGDLGPRPLWLFTSGPIASRCGPASRERDDDDTDSAVEIVARSVGARGAASFGALPAPDASADIAEGPAVDLDRVRDWAHGIARQLRFDLAVPIAG